MNEMALESESGKTFKRRTFWTDSYRRFVRNKLAIVGFGMVVGLLLMVLLAEHITPQAYDESHFDQTWRFPSPQHWMGTDGLGRDLYSRIVFGGRVALAVGLFSQVIAFAIGIPLGLIAGFQGGKVDFLIMRLVDVTWAIPRMLFAVLVMVVLGTGLTNVLLAIGVTGWVPLCRLTRAQVIKEKEKEYILAARVIGIRTPRIIFRHIVPNVFAPIIVALTLGIPEAIFTEAGLSFLGLGVNPPMPSWGAMIGDSVNHIRYYWHLALFPALMIAVVMFAFTLFGDGLRDALDVQMTR